MIKKYICDKCEGINYIEECDIENMKCRLGESEQVHEDCDDCKHSKNIIWCNGSLKEIIVKDIK